MLYDEDSLYKDESVENSPELAKGLNSSAFQYNCSRCGSTFYSFAKQNIDNCIICCENGIVEDSYTNFKNSYLVPFNKLTKDFIRMYKRKVFWNPLVPIQFKKKKVMWLVKDVYLPCFLSNVNQKGELYFLGGERGKNSYNVMETKRYTVFETIHFDYCDVLLNINSKIDDKIFQTICNYDFSHLEKIDFSGKSQSFYLVDNMSVATVSEKAREKISKQTMAVARQNIPHPLKKLKTDKTTITFADTKELFVPVYLLNVKYKNKIYQFIMNGQNGKFYFDIPMGIVETVLFVIFSFSIIFLLSFLIAYFL